MQDSKRRTKDFVFRFANEAFAAWHANDTAEHIASFDACFKLHIGGKDIADAAFDMLTAKRYSDST